MSRPIQFDDSSIQEIFGHEAAEDENPSRLREYYFKSAVFDRITANIPLRILVGHKGIGKSALFKVAIQEDLERHRLPITIRPDDVVGITTSGSDFLQAIRDWKLGLVQIIARKALAHFGVFDDAAISKVSRPGGSVLNLLCDFLQLYLKNTTRVGSPDEQRMDNFLNSKQINIYIDDLDRGWSGNKHDIVRISALLNALRDLGNDGAGLFFKVSLRTDVYFLVRTSDESTDKTEGAVVWYSWTNFEILAMLVKRVETYRGRHVDEETLLATRQAELAAYLDPVMEPRFRGRGHWDNAPTYRVIMSLIRKRPRDLVKLCTLAAHHARRDREPRITTTDFDAIFEDYSQGRLQDTFNEYRSELPEIERLLMGMKPNKKERQASLGYAYDTAGLLAKIKAILEQGSFKYANGRMATPRDLAQFMYKINFLTARKVMANNLVVRKYFEENRYISSDFADFGFDWEIHPAYRWALQPDDLKSIFLRLELSED